MPPLSINGQHNSDYTDEEMMARFQILCQYSEECSMISESMKSKSCNSDDYNVLEGIFSIGLGFDGTQGYDLQSRRSPLINHDCTQTRTFELAGEIYDVPATISPENNLQSEGSFRTYSTLESFKKTKAEKAGVSNERNTLRKIVATAQYEKTHNRFHRVDR